MAYDEECEESNERTVCSACGGSGVIENDLDDDGSDFGTSECAVCGGTGYED